MQDIRNYQLAFLESLSRTMAHSHVESSRTQLTAGKSRSFGSERVTQGRQHRSSNLRRMQLVAIKND